MSVSMLACAAVLTVTGQSTDLTVDWIMRDPKWMGLPPQNARWSDDSQSIIFTRDRLTDDQSDLVIIDLEGNEVEVLPPGDHHQADAPTHALSPDRRWKAWTSHGDIFVKRLDIQAAEPLQLTRTLDRESSPTFMADSRRLAFSRGGNIFIRDLHSGLEYEPVELRAGKPPKSGPEDNYLAKQQDRLIGIVSERRQKREANRDAETEARRKDPTRVPPPVYLSANGDIRQRSLSPNEKWMLARVSKSGSRGTADTMPEFVTESSLVGTRNVRALVGTASQTNETIYLIDIASAETFQLKTDDLPGITDDPLKAVKEENEAARKKQQSADTNEPPEPQSETPDPAPTTEETKPGPPRPVWFRRILWSRNGDHAIADIYSRDRKDRWIVAIDVEARSLQPLEHFRDEAWINLSRSELGWLADNNTIYFTSEHEGHARLYLRSLTAETSTPATGLNYEARNIDLSRDDRFLYFQANATHPTIWEVHRYDLESKTEQQLTDLNGISEAVLSPDGATLLITHSNTLWPNELYIQPAQPGATPTRLTDSRSSEFKGTAWIKPDLIEVPSRHGFPIHSRLYTPPEGVTPNGAAVVFIHGAGYLQNAHAGWSQYFREFMFHSLLARRGYTVLDMDYRASSGYGRDWRTAIYRQMGTPEVEDLADGVTWLTQNHDIDPNRIGVYGGSYGGFLTLMAMFREPDLFACGAALRSVTDWAHYHDWYTRNILNTPDIDPIAYERSSPIEFAEGLEGALLMCHGMVDDNVLAKDTIRLAQRLIELGKENWEMALYPVEPHTFREPSSWADEYRRILDLFETHLQED